MVTPAVIRKLVGETNRIGGTTLMDRLDKIAAAHPGRTHGGLIQDKTFNSRQIRPRSKDDTNCSHFQLQFDFGS
jgi:hypothetical protein